MRKRPNYDDSEERRKKIPRDLTDAVALVQQTQLLVSQLERKYGDEAKELVNTTRETRERLVSSAVEAWIARNFSRCLAELYDQSPPPESISRTGLRKMINAYLETLGLPPLSKHDAVWTKRILRQCIGYTDADWRGGKKIALKDLRSLVNFEATLKDLLDDVRDAQQTAESLA
jgi:hypothetical protein